MYLESVCVDAQLLVKSINRTSDIYELAYLCIDQLYEKFCSVDDIDSSDAKKALKSLGLIIIKYNRQIDNICDKKSKLKLESGSLYGELALEDYPDEDPNEDNEIGYDPFIGSMELE